MASRLLSWMLIIVFVHHIQSAVKILEEINDEIHILRNSSVVIQCVSDVEGFIKTHWCSGTYEPLSTRDTYLCDNYFYFSSITNGDCSCLNTAITSCNGAIFHISAEKIQECQDNVFDCSVFDDEASFISQVNATLRIHDIPTDPPTQALLSSSSVTSVSNTAIVATMAEPMTSTSSVPDSVTPLPSSTTPFPSPLTTGCPSPFPGPLTTRCPSPSPLTTTCPSPSPSPCICSVTSSFTTTTTETLSIDGANNNSATNLQTLEGSIISAVSLQLVNTLLLISIIVLQICILLKFCQCSKFASKGLDSTVVHGNNNTFDLESHA